MCLPNIFDHAEWHDKILKSPPELQSCGGLLQPHYLDSCRTEKVLLVGLFLFVCVCSRVRVTTCTRYNMLQELFRISTIGVTYITSSKMMCNERNTGGIKPGGFLCLVIFPFPWPWIEVVPYVQTNSGVANKGKLGEVHAAFDCFVQTIYRMSTRKFLTHICIWEKSSNIWNFARMWHYLQQFGGKMRQQYRFWEETAFKARKDACQLATIALHGQPYWRVVWHQCHNN